MKKKQKVAVMIVLMLKSLLNTKTEKDKDDHRGDENNCKSTST